MKKDNQDTNNNTAKGNRTKRMIMLCLFTMQQQGLWTCSSFLLRPTSTTMVGRMTNHHARAASNQRDATVLGEKTVLGNTMKNNEDEPDIDDDVPPIYDPTAKAVDVFKHPYFYGGDKEAAKAASKLREEVLGNMTVKEVYDKYVKDDST